MNFSGISRVFIGLGILLIVIGILAPIAGKIPWIGHLPGDFVVKRKNFFFYFPLATGLFISLILTLLINFLFRR